MISFKEHVQNTEICDRTLKRKTIKFDGKMLHARNDGNSAMAIDWDTSTTRVESKKSQKRSFDSNSVDNNMEITAHMKRTKRDIVIERKVNLKKNENVNSQRM